MLDLGSTSFRLETPALGKARLSAYARDLFARYDHRLETKLRLVDYAVHLELEEGSLKGKAGVLATLSALYLGIATYGSFRGGLREIRSDVVAVQEALAHDAAATAGSAREPNIRRYSGTMGQLEALFRRVQYGELSAEAATKLAMALVVRDHDEVPPGFEMAMRRAMESCPRDPVQTMLPDLEEGPAPEPQPPEPRRPRHEPPIADRRRYRIEMSRESKSGKLSVSISLV